MLRRQQTASAQVLEALPEWAWVPPGQALAGLDPGERGKTNPIPMFRPAPSRAGGVLI